MKQGTLLYLGMLLLLGVGLETIRRWGVTLTPPHHIAGLWRFPVSSSTDPCPILEFESAGEGELQVEQSGRYLHLIFPDTRRTRLGAYFTDGVFQGSVPSTQSCAAGTMVHLDGHLTENRLDLIFTRALQPSEASTATLSFSATRTADSTDRAQTSTQPLDRRNN